MNRRIPYSIERVSDDRMREQALRLYKLFGNRRSIREFSSDPVPSGVIEHLLQIAGSAPNGANLQPWHFVVVRDAELKKRIRDAAEKEEQAFYETRAPREWLETLAPLGTEAEKPFLESAPVLIAIFLKNKVKGPGGAMRKTYYPKESIGIATGFLIAALHQVGLACLTHTPSPMHFLNNLLKRPPEEKPFLLLVVGYPTDGCTVPAIEKLPLDSIASFL